MPLNEALAMVEVIWSRSELKSVCMALRDVVSSDVSEAARAFDFIWVSRSVIESPADIATSTTEELRFSESVTASSDDTVARWFWAMAVAQILWGGLALRHGAALGWLRGVLQGLADFGSARKSCAPFDAKVLDALLRSNERLIRDLQTSTGFDSYWKLYFLLTGGGAK